MPDIETFSDRLHSDIVRGLLQDHLHLYEEDYAREEQSWEQDDWNTVRREVMIVMVL